MEFKRYQFEVRDDSKWFFCMFDRLFGNLKPIRGFKVMR